MAVQDHSFTSVRIYHSGHTILGITLQGDSMSNESRIPTLVQYCQRVASSYVDSISSLGDEFRFDLIEPVLSGCSAETLSRLESNSPCLEDTTANLWRATCFKAYPIAADRYKSGKIEAPESWRDQYYVLKAAEAKKLEELGSRLRTQRLEAEEHRREREVKLTDKVPPPKRARTTGWGTSSQPKSLFQKTRTEASKISKTMYTPRVLPPMPRAKDYRPTGVSHGGGILLPPPPPSSGKSCVVVKTTYRRAPSTSSSVTSSSAASSTSPSPVLEKLPHPTPQPKSKSTKAPPPPPQPSPQQAEPRPNKSPAKKDPMSALFMPKHRAHSQRPQSITTR